MISTWQTSWCLVFTGLRSIGIRWDWNKLYGNNPLLWPLLKNGKVTVPVTESFSDKLVFEYSIFGLTSFQSCHAVVCQCKSHSAFTGILPVISPLPCRPSLNVRAMAQECPTPSCSVPQLPPLRLPVAHIYTAGHPESTHPGLACPAEGFCQLSTNQMTAAFHHSNCHCPPNILPQTALTAEYLTSVNFHVVQVHFIVKCTKAVKQNNIFNTFCINIWVLFCFVFSYNATRRISIHLLL